jgi:hypothetical protein
MHRVRDCAFATGSKLIEFEGATKVLTDQCAAVLAKETKRAIGEK